MIPKLFQWLLGASLFLSVWLAFILDYVKVELTKSQRDLIFISPVLALGTFAVISLAIIIYRVAIFNDCKEAAEELQQQIAEAKDDLKKKGFKFDET